MSLRGGHILTLHELRAQGKSIHEIARLTGHSRNTVRKYLKLRDLPQPKPRPPRKSKLEPFKPHILGWLQEGIYNCEVLLEKLRAIGFTGGKTIVKDFVKALRPPRLPKAVMRFETAPGEQAQVDWGVCKYRDPEGHERHVNAFVMTLGYSRDQYVEFVNRADISTFLRCFVHALEYFGGVPRVILFDNMKTVKIGMDASGRPIWHPLFADFALAAGFQPRVCRPRRAQTKGKVENGIRFLKGNFWPGRRFTDLEDLNRQVRAWCEKVSRRIHGTTGRRPCDMRTEERLQPLPAPAVLASYLVETRPVSRDGFVSYDGCRYGVPWPLAGREVQVRPSGAYVEILYEGKRVALHPKALLPRTRVPFIGQYEGIPLTAIPRHQTPVAIQIATPEVEIRSLRVYDALAAAGGGAE